MLFELAIAAYAAASGFVAAGVLASFYQLVTDRPARFAVEIESFGKGVVGVLLCAIAGPFIIMRNAIRGRMLERRPVGWLVASTAIATGWSLCSGVLVLQTVIAMRQGLI
ncbi:hypothetical protein EYW49_19385 [Siculibacillus lacustris]|uniref:Uncharacterized protein n=1 Tax=Siculibacillus lacustris TaxID=1549641 RepID=A0A4Q9VFZ3_9HYPH|nr:hypothetical protein [Siculibacillus lacustris]TBW33891.1 hypothetical protein EYW49_19385 [Siculibacillus lacustris]